MRTSSRGEVDPFIVMDVMEEARAEEERGRHIIHMEVGQPAATIPDSAREALVEAMETDPLGYTVALGLPELREGIAALYDDWYGIDLDPQRVIVTSGSTAGFILAFTSLFDEGDRVAIGDPGYPSYRNILRSLGYQPVGIQTSAEHRFQPRPQDLTGDLSGLLVASPGNPTGTILPREDLSSLIGAAQDRGIAYISDEIYHGLHYDAPATSALELSDRVYVINSFSKFFCLTGWRIGWMIVPPEHVRRIERIAQNMFICAPHVSQVAALAALRSRGELEERVPQYGRNREILLKGLPEAGFRKITRPDGAFYIYADVSEFTSDSRAFATQLLREAGVSVTPGLDFDPGRGHGTIRFSFAGDEGELREGLRRLGNWMGKQRAGRAQSGRPGGIRNLPDAPPRRAAL
ncbi:pyridoxal phosphate-dependent aminotransferase [Amaricoccus macauensis]|uniref:pyridoxal phosphate-dependent aminotransferase n=1 Tax=Amaricoccus macauensis TaxID=57001 RepID=UPI003C7D98FA